MLSNVGLTRTYWPKAINTSCYMINLEPRTGIDFKTPCELWFGKSTGCSKLRVFGYTIYYHVNEGELEPRAKMAIFVGYEDGVKGYRIWSKSKRRVILSRNIAFDKNYMFNPTVKFTILEDCGFEKQMKQRETRANCEA